VICVDRPPGIVDGARMTATASVSDRAAACVTACGAELSPQGRAARSPITGEPLCAVPDGDPAGAVADALAAFPTWRKRPAPARGSVIKRLGTLIEEHRRELAELITLEAGKIAADARGEVQEMVDMCDLAVGLSRQLDGRTFASERPSHRLMESWHPLGVVAVISAFNFPAAVWSWNAAIALVCGNPVVWKPSPQTQLTALACARCSTGRWPSTTRRRAFIGWCSVARRPAERSSITPRSRWSAPPDRSAWAPRSDRASRLGSGDRCSRWAATARPSSVTRRISTSRPALAFAAVGTAGQRCTTLRRLIVHETIAEELCGRLVKAYESLSIGDPREPGTRVGPLIDRRAFTAMQTALDAARADGGTVLCGGTRHETELWPSAFYVTPAIMQMPAQTDIVRRETFAPLLYVLTYDDLDEAIAIQNDVPQGLSSAIFTRDQQEAERFIAAGGSDCGIANVNSGTSGAEIGGAFGGEGTTGGGREAGSDAWRAYMRRQTITINYGSEMPLAQGIAFA
jgi:aldehyde dehydrogenase (NAD+)